MNDSVEMPVPVRVRKYAVILGTALRRADVTPVVSFHEGQWKIAMDNIGGPEEDSHFAILMRKNSKAKYRIDYVLTIEGEVQDVKSLSEALMRLMHRGGGGDATSAVTGAAAAASTNSVTARRASVIRV